MSTIRLTVTKELEEVLTFLENRYKPLSRSEILKLGLAKIYSSALEDLPVHKLTPEQEKDLEESLKDYEKGNFTVLKTNKDVDDYFDNLDS